jgi:hypothetical protein
VTRRAILFAAIILFACCLGARLIPQPLSDRGIFISVAERLLSGDKLYADVYDNKDPLFYYMVALQRLAGPLTEYLFELSMVVLSGTCAYLIASGLSVSISAAALVGCVAIPLVSTGPFYYAGDTQLPATALALLACGLFMRNRPLAAGIVMSMIVFTKLIVAPLPVVFCVTYAWIKETPSAMLGLAKRVALGFVSFTLVFLLFLHLRDGLRPFIDTQILNVQYSRSNLVDNSGLVSSVATHFYTMFLSGRRNVTLALSATACAIGLLVTMRRTALGIEWLAFSYSVIVTLVCSVLVLAVTGLWNRHVQTMYFVDSLIIICVTGLVLDRLRSKLVASGAIVLLSALLSGSTDVRDYLADPREFRQKLLAIRVPSDETLGLIRETGPAGYARIGLNDDNGHAFLLTKYHLVCRDFHQYYFYDKERLARILNCAARAPFLIVSGSVSKWDTAPEWLPPYSNRESLTKTWNEYVDNVEAMLSRDFSCRRLDTSRARVCRNVNSASTTMSQSRRCELRRKVFTARASSSDLCRSCGAP